MVGKSDGFVEGGADGAMLLEGTLLGVLEGEKLADGDSERFSFVGMLGLTLGPEDGKVLGSTVEVALLLSMEGLVDGL